MKNGLFIYRSWRTGQLITMRVRDCPDPAAARLALEQDVVGGPVAWQEQK